jgi:uncharacterized phiE125 gp8 family phage protein
MALKLITPPSGYPVSLYMAKAHLRIDTPDDDTLITAMIGAATEYAENACRRAFITQQWRLYLDAFPPRHYSGVIAGRLPVREDQGSWFDGRIFDYDIRQGKISLPFPVLQTVDSIQYVDVNGVLQTLDPSQYVVDDAGQPGAVMPAPNTYWPATQSVANAVRINYTAGYGDSTKVPSSICAWILMRVGALYENREEIVVGQRLTSVDLPFVDRMLDRYRIRKYV